MNRTVRKTMTLAVRAVAATAILAIFLIPFSDRADAQVAPQAVPTPPTTAAPALAPVTPVPPPAQEPSGPTGPTSSPDKASLSIDVGDAVAKPSQSILIIILITILSVAPALLIMTTSFTRIIIVLTLTRNAMGVQSIPPNQVLVGLALFLSLFIMGPTFSQMNKEAVQPYLKGQLTQSQAYDKGVQPIRKFMLKQTRKAELGLFVKASGAKRPSTPEKVSMTALVPAFILSELKTAFIIGFVVFIPFLVIDLIVSSSLMSMGMMMLPPVLVSLPFKLLMFVLVDGWALIIRSLLQSFQ